MLSAVASIADSALPARQINADFEQPLGKLDRFYQFCVGSERAGVMLRPENQTQLELVRRELVFRFIRFHGLFHDDMHVYHEEAGKPVYDWTRIDELYDSFLKMGMKPFIELSFMPHDLASGESAIFYWKGNITPPTDYGKWADLIASLVQHLEDRYGQSEVRSWYFEVWNEPNLDLFWTGTQADYFRLYDVTAAAIKRIDPLLHVGGPATAACEWITPMIDHCVQNKIPLDFISTHTYAVTSGALDADGHADTKLSPDPDSISSDIRMVRQNIRESKMPSLPLHFTEWSASYSSRDPIHDAYFSAAFILDRIKKSEGFVDSMSYWTYSDLFEENGPPPASFHGGFGLLNREGIRKPAYFAYRYLNELGDEQLKTDDPRCWVCRRGSDCTVLFWDYTQPEQDTTNRTWFRIKHPPANRPPVTLNIAHVPPGEYALEVHRTGYQANDACSTYIDLGLPKDLSAGKIQTLRQETTDKPESSKNIVIKDDGAFTATLPLRENDIVLVRLRRLP
jgi:xylan 1,4-beta-xylosidase